ncbi:hypothetical protein KJ996_00100 [Patescibacteria group bacterium]|nr:hypothetical protein [Patescibacteria group bacterium]
MNTMNTTGMTDTGFGVVWLHVHWLFAALAAAGLVLLVIWASKDLTKEKLKSLMIWLLTIGIIGTLLTASASIGLHNMKGAQCDGSMMKEPMMERMMEMMMEHDKDEDEDHEDMRGMMDINQPSEMMNQ